MYFVFHNPYLLVFTLAVVFGLGYSFLFLFGVQALLLTLGVLLLGIPFGILASVEELNLIVVIITFISAIPALAFFKQYSYSINKEK